MSLEPVAPTPSGNEGLPRKTVYSVQVMRGFAAAAVAIYHTHLILLNPQYGSIDIYGAVATRGWIGVNFFFVLSGFIILLAHYRDIGAPRQAGRYLWRRFVRVYPIYWLFTTAYVAAALAGIGYPDFRWTFSNMLSSYALIAFEPQPLPPLSVAWTLFYEITFYAMFLLLILNRTLGIAAFAVWTIAILVNTVLLANSSIEVLDVWNIYFAIGMGAYIAFRRMDGRWGLPLFGIGALLLVGVFAAGVIPSRIAFAEDHPLLLMALALIFALILTGAALYERDRSIRMPKALLLLGDASFSVYLLHSPALSLIAGLNKRLIPGLLPDWLLFWAAAAASILAGILAHLLVERPLLKAVNLQVGRLHRRAEMPSPVAQ